MNIIFDYNRTLFDPDAGTLYPGVVELLQDLSEAHELFLVSRDSPGRMDELDAFGIVHRFKRVAFVAEKTPELFKNLASNGKHTVVIGDRVRGEIRIGNELGFTTVWIQLGKFAFELPVHPNEQPTITIRGIEEIRSVISRYER